MAISFEHIANCGETKMTYLRTLCDNNNIEVRIMSDVDKPDRIVCRFTRENKEVKLKLPAREFFADTKDTERRLVMIVCWSFGIRATSDDSAQLIFKAVRGLQDGTVIIKP